MPRNPRADLAFIFGLVGGILILVTVLIFFPFFGGLGYYGPFLFGFIGVIATIVSGVLIIVGAAMVFRTPENGILWGIIMIVFASLSLLGLGGFFLGMALATTGGALAIVGGSEARAAPAGRQRACTNCGMFIPIDVAFCPECGHAVRRLGSQPQA